VTLRRWKRFRALLHAGAFLLVSCASAGPVRAAAPPTSWSHWTEIDGACVHYIDTAPASELPVLLVLPGFLGSTATFEPLADALSRDLRVVVPDLPGFGWSAPPQGRCTMADRLAFVGAFARTLDVGPVFLAGSSLGANIAVRYAIENPDRVRRLVLLSPFGLAEQRQAVAPLERLDPVLPFAALFVTRRFIARQVGKQVSDPAVLTRNILESFCRPFRSAGGRRVVVAVLRHLLYGTFFDEELPRVPQPTLALAGGDDAYRCQEILDTLQARMVSCTTRRLEGCRHLIQLDAPAEVAELVRCFCAADAR
jgi:pimeloyl-ACP methyl ester carboxylesterase